MKHPDDLLANALTRTFTRRKPSIDSRVGKYAKVSALGINVHRWAAHQDKTPFMAAFLACRAHPTYFPVPASPDTWKFLVYATEV